jgi:hypothetical protein
MIRAVLIAAALVLGGCALPLITLAPVAMDGAVEIFTAYEAAHPHTAASAPVVAINSPPGGLALPATLPPTPVAGTTQE